MTPTQGEHAQTALRLADEYAAAHAKWALEDLYGSSRSYTSEKLAERHAARAKLERALHAQVAALTAGNREELAHELFAAAQLAPGEGIEDAVSRIAAALTAAPSVSDGLRTLREAILNRLSHAELLEKAHYLMELNSNQARTIGELQDLVEATPAQPAAPQGVAYAEPSEFPAGAIVNGRTHIDRLESFYSFDCEAGPLINCDDWHGLKRCFEHLAERASHGQAPAGAVPDEQMIAEYGIKASRMMARDLTRFDAACEVDKYLREQGAPGYYRHRMSIILFGNVEGTEASRAPENSEPSPTAQAAPAAGAVAEPWWKSEDIEVTLYPPMPTSGLQIGMPKGVKVMHKPTGLFAVSEDERSQHMNREVAWNKLQEMLAAAPPAQAADSVLEDAALLDWIQHNGATVEVIPGRPNYDWCFRVAGLHATTRNNIREAINAARKQGGKHD